MPTVSFSTLFCVAKIQPGDEAKTGMYHQTTQGK